MRKIFTSLFLVSFALFANAQYYIPNSGFEEWKVEKGYEMGDTYQSSSGGGMRERPGDEPLSWEGSSINQNVVMEKKETLIEKSSYNGNAVKMTNKYVGVNLWFMKIGSNAPAFISFATPWVYSVSTVSECDGGVYGGIEFKGRPDAIKGMFNRSGGTGETAHIIVYTWKGTFKSNIKSSTSNDTKEDVDKAVLGKEENLLQSGTRIVYNDYTFASTNGWEEITVLLHYPNDEIPEKMNVILSSGDYWARDGIMDGSVLEADDVQFVYYSELASLKYNGVEYFRSGQTSYTINGVYDESKLEITSNGKGASIEKSYDASSKVLTVTIKGDDFSVNSSNQHVYTVAFNEEGGGEVVPPVVDPDGVKPLGSRLTSLAAADANKTYVLYNEHFTAYAVYKDGYFGKLWAAGMQGDSGHALKDQTYSAPVDLTSPNSCWTVVEAGGKYRLYNVGAEMYLDTPESGDVATYCSFSSEPVDLWALELGDGKFAFRATNDDYGYMCASPQLDGPVSIWDSGDAGSAWVLIENPNVTVGEVVEPELPEQPEIGDVDYTPAFTGVKTVSTGTAQDKRWIETITLTSGAYGDEPANVLNVDNSGRLCYNDYSATVAMKAAPGEEVTLAVNIGDGSWINSYAYIDADNNGFAASVASDGYTPQGDLVSYSFYNNGGTSDGNGRNSEGDYVSGDNRSTLDLPSFTVPEEPGVYRMRVKIDWCNIDPMGDRDGLFGDFMANGGQIVDFMLQVVDPDVPGTGIEGVEEEQPVVEGIYDLQGRKLMEITKSGIYIINGKKVFVK